MNKSTHIYIFTAEYTKYPGGRLRKDGPYSGEAFREDVLVPLTNNYEKIRIDLSGTQGFGSSFLDESFGEMGKRLGTKKCRSIFEFISDDDPAVVTLIWAKIEKAAAT